MFGEFITRTLLMLIAYAYPAFECYKTVEKNTIEIQQLRFWCQYWIIVALITVFERFADVLISGLPMYGEMKLAFFVYLWHPKTKGTSFVYRTLLRPFMSKHETEIERSLQSLQARVWDLAVLYWQNGAQFGQAAFCQILQYFAKDSTFQKVVSSTLFGESTPPVSSNNPHNKKRSLWRVPLTQMRLEQAGLLPLTSP